MLIQAVPNIGSAVTLVDDSDHFGDQVPLIGEAEFGNAKWDHAYSGMRGTQGAVPASGVPPNRPLVLPFRVYGTTKDDLAANISALEECSTRLRRFGGRIKFQSNNQSNAQYFEVMDGQLALRAWGGSAEVNNRAEFQIEAICAPYLTGDAMAPITFSSQTLPQVLSLTSTIPGDAPALAEVSVTATGGAAAPIWAMLGWTERPGTPLATSVAPFGLIEAESGANLSGFAVAAGAGSRGGNNLTWATSGAGTGTVSWLVDPSVLTPDDYARGEVEVEAWIRVWTVAGHISPKLTLSVRPEDGTTFGAERFTNEWGSAGKLLTKPSSGGAWRWVRLGTLPLVVDRSAPRRWRLWLTATVAAASAGDMSLDYLALVPSRKRALGPTGKANDSAYPKFIASTSNTTKTIRSDLSAGVNSGAFAAANQHPDHGLGGQLLELPPGNVDVLVKLSNLVPDDPTSDTSSEQLAHTSSTVRFDVTPRWAYLRTA